MAAHSSNSPVSTRPSWVIWTLLGVVVAAGFLIRLNELGQPSMKDLDEAFHAIVARNMIEHPFQPMLYVKPYLPYDYQNWLSNHIWLHKPPLALWQMAASMAFFGESNFTMRLPSLLLSAASVVLTFLIGQRLGDSKAGLVAATFQSLCPAITRLVHGQVFSDHVDTALLFYCEFSIWTLLRSAESGAMRGALLAGLLMGLGWLTKSFPATFVFGLAVALWLLRSRVVWPNTFRFSGRQLIVFTVASIAICIPWVAWCMYAFPREYWYEQVHVFRHLSEDIETFGNPWDRLVFDYLRTVLLEWYPLVFVAATLLFVDALRERAGGRVFVALWILGVFVPHLLATSKTPSATLIGWPALWLAAGFCVSDALRGRAVSIGIALVAGLILLRPYPPPIVLAKDQVQHFGQIMLSQWRLLIEIGVVFLAGGAAWALRSQIARMPATRVALLLALAFVFPIARHAVIAYRTGDDAPEQPVAFPKLGDFVRKNAPLNAVFFVDNLSRGEHLIAMWWFDRTCYPLVGERFGEDVQTVLSQGGIPFVVSRGERPEPILQREEGETTIYRLDSPAAPAGKN